MKTSGVCAVFNRVATGEITADEGADLLMQLSRPHQARCWRFIHNAIAHPLMELLPARIGDRLHDWTAARAFIRLETRSPTEGKP